MRWAAPLLAVALLAGCAEAPEPLPVMEAVPLPSLFGVVQDETGRPLSGALVSVGEAAEVSTDGNGSFAFELPPGHYALSAALDGHRPAFTTVAVVEQLSARVVFTLSSWDSLPGMVAVMEHRGFLECAVQVAHYGPDCPGGAPGADAFTMPLDWATDPIKDVILEVIWDAVATSNQELQVIVYRGDAWVAQATGASPLRIHLTEDTVALLHDLDVEVTVASGDGVGFAVAQSFEAYASVFLNQEAAADYSIRSS